MPYVSYPCDATWAIFFPRCPPADVGRVRGHPLARSLLKDALNNLSKGQNKLSRERERPQAWSKQQVEDMFDVWNTIADILDALSLLSAQVRDD